MLHVLFIQARESITLGRFTKVDSNNNLDFRLKLEAFELCQTLAS